MSRFLTLAGLAGLAVVVLGTGGCANPNTLAEASFYGGAAQYEPRTGQLYRMYDYYPDAQVYYSPFTTTYFWRNRDGNGFGTTWQNGPTLPTTIALSDSSQVVVQLPTPRPYEMHDQIEPGYPSLATLRAQADAPDSAPATAFASAPIE